MKYLIIAIVALALGACATKPPTMYYWGNYSSTLYEYKKEPTTETLTNHYESILDVFQKSQEYGLRVPPSIHGDYGMLLLSEGKTAEALNQFNLEKSVYPESSTMMNLLIERASLGK